MVQNKYPIYIISKGRWESRQTVKALEKMNVPYKICVEPSEINEYMTVIDKDKILQLPENFSEKKQGSILVRNWVFEYSIENGDKRHWILDDNLRWFARLHKNKKTQCIDATPFKVCEDFTDRYKNIALSGLQYEMFTPASQKAYPYKLNTRIYSCILINNKIPHRWRGRYNEDTDLSLRVLKDGWCTVLIQAFICKKATTMTMKGGNEQIYRESNNRYDFAKALKDQHPDLVEIIWRYNRYHHEVNYKPFRINRLKLKDGIKLKDKSNEYGLKLIPKINYGMS